MSITIHDRRCRLTDQPLPTARSAELRTALQIAWERLGVEPLPEPARRQLQPGAAGARHGQRSGATNAIQVRSTEAQASRPSAPPEDLVAAVKALGEAWPPPAKRPEGAPADWRPPPPSPFELRVFRQRARALDVVKLAKVSDLLAASPADRALEARALTDTLELIHGKRGHTQTVEKAIGLFLEDPALAASIRERFGMDEAMFTTAVARIRTAASLMDLGEVYTPTAVLAARRPLTASERERYIEPHPTLSVELVRRAGLSDDAGLEVIANHATYRPYETVPESALKSGAVPRDDFRSPAAQILGLLDQIAALSEKRFFRTEDGTLDRKKIVAELEKNAMRPDGKGNVELLIDPALLRMMVERLEKLDRI